MLRKCYFLPEVLAEALRRYCEKYGCMEAEIVRLAIRQFLEKYAENNN